MHVEIKYAQNFVLNFLYNKLPRRRVNLFGEELELALRDKFKDHWYPDKPFKGSAFRCLKITDPADPVLNRAARESGNPILDIIENLPTDLAIWIDPGEVSYRIGEKGSVKILYSEKDGNPFFQGGGGSSSSGSSSGNSTGSLGLFNTFNNGSNEDLNPEIVGLLSADSLAAGLSNLSLSRSQPNVVVKNASSPPSPFSSNSANNSNSGNNSNNTPPQQPLTYTAGMFAQTKFGSTKLKTSGKKTSRMSPTEFSNYIKTRAALQKQQQQQHHQQPFNPRMNRGGSLRGPNLSNEDAGGYFGCSTTSSFNSTSPSSYNNNDPFKNGGQALVSSLMKPPPPPPPPPQASSSSPPSSNSPSSSSWTYASDPETEAFLQDIFSVGLRSQVGNQDYAYDLPPNNNNGGFMGGGASFGTTRGEGGQLGRPINNNNPSSHHFSSSSSSSSFKPSSNPGQPSDKYQQRVLVAN